MKSLPFLIFLLSLVMYRIIIISAAAAADNSNLVYKGCAKEGLSDPNGVYSSALSGIFGTLIQQSSKSKFFKTTSGTVSGLFQCRGDLSNVECYSCVSRLPILMDKLCGKTVAAARIQLLGCYMLYEVSGFPQISGMELLYKKCGKTTGRNGLQQTRDSAFSSLESVLGSGNNNNNNGGFYTTNYDSVYVLGQCQGDLGASDCGNCVKSAVQTAQVGCGGSISGQVYLHRCFISYNYYPNGTPTRDGPSSSSSSSYSSPSSSTSGSNPGRTVAIILGGAAGVGFIIVVLLIARKAMKKDDD